jgi:adenylate kinase
MFAISAAPHDKPETVKNRLEVYKKQTEPLIDYYDKKGLLKTVDSTGTPNEVHEKILKALE